MGKMLFRLQWVESRIFLPPALTDGFPFPYPNVWGSESGGQPGPHTLVSTPRLPCENKEEEEEEELSITFKAEEEEDGRGGF